MTVKSELLDTAEHPLKTIVFIDLRLVGCRARQVAGDADEASNVQTAHRTTIRIDNFKANQNVKDELFTPRYMEASETRPGAAAPLAAGLASSRRRPRCGRPTSKAAQGGWREALNASGSLRGAYRSSTRDPRRPQQHSQRLGPG
jgi:hypothetical protein